LQVSSITEFSLLKEVGMSRTEYVALPDSSLPGRLFNDLQLPLDSTQAFRERRSQDRRDGDLRESNRLLCASEQRFQLVVESVTDYAIYMLDPEGRVTSWNVGAERLKGYKAEEVLGQKISMFFLPEAVEAGMPAQELTAAALEGRCEKEGWRLRKDGSRFWALVTLTAIPGPNGELQGFAKITRDMTRQKEAEDALKCLNAQLDRYRIIVEGVADHVIFTLDAEGRIDSWSAGTPDVIGYSAEEALGREYSMVFTPEEIDAGMPGREMEEAERNGHCATQDWRVCRDGSRKWVIGVLTAVRDETGKLTGYIRVARDMTVQKRHEESLAQAAIDLERSVVERTLQLQETVAQLRVNNKEKEVLLREVYHRVKNNLQVVQSLLKMRGRSLRSVEARRAIETSVQRIHVMAMAHERLYNMPDVTNLSMSTYLRDVIAGAIKSNSEQPDSIDFELDSEEILLTLQVAIPFGLMANEIVTNCLKHGIPEGRPGKILVSVRRIPGAVRMIVKDNGVGLPADFDLANCNSMGLKLAASLAHQLGGHLNFSSDDGCQVQADLTRLGLHVAKRDELVLGAV
jgi:PAS domain S-box-containing protein